MKKILVRNSIVVALAVVSTPWASAVVIGPIDIKISLKIPCDKPAKEYTLGTIGGTVNGADKAGKGLDAKLTVKKEADGGAPASIFDCLKFHWFQTIPDRAAPTKYMGKTDYAFPICDQPPKGWDYNYKDEDRTKGAADPSWEDDIKDVDPWYHTMEEEAGKGGNEDGGFGKFDKGKEYGIKDEPGIGGGNPTKNFTSWLVATPMFDCDSADCLKKGQFLLLGGFNWTYAEKEADVKVSTATINAAASTNAQKALDNKDAKFTGWTAFDKGNFCCPEPGSFVTLAFAGALLLRRRRG